MKGVKHGSYNNTNSFLLKPVQPIMPKNLVLFIHTIHEEYNDEDIYV
jgi:hypothetical protein